MARAIQPSQKQLVLPLCEALASTKQAKPTAWLCDAVAERIGLDSADRGQSVAIGGRQFNAFARNVRWAQQQAKAQRLVDHVGKDAWAANAKTALALTQATPGKVVTIFVTSLGRALWASCEDAVGLLEDGEVQLMLSSPPYPILRQKAYGGHSDEHQYIDWLLRILETWPRKLASNGSVVLNLGDAWNKGEPTVSLYQERLLVRLEDEFGWKLCQRFAWHNPAKLPAPAEWVNVRRVRVKPSLESVLWLAPNDMPEADNRKVLTAYSEAMRKKLDGGGETVSAHRPSGHEMSARAFATDNGGSIPTNLLIASNTASNDGYTKACKEAGLPVHPARFPAELPRFFIKMLTEPDQLVVDFFGGSGNTARQAEDLGRRWMICDRVREYLQGGAFRFTGLSHVPA